MMSEPLRFSMKKLNEKDILSQPKELKNNLEKKVQENKDPVTWSEAIARSYIEQINCLYYNKG